MVVEMPPRRIGKGKKNAKSAKNRRKGDKSGQIAERTDKLAKKAGERFLGKATRKGVKGAGKANKGGEKQK